MLIPFTQYLLPDGRQRSIKWDCTTREQEIKAQALIDAGAVFEAEMLQTRDISLTCELKDNSGEMQILSHEICANNPEVIDAVARLVENAHEKLIKNSND